jgi:FixJ family two-component response regulator
MGNPRMTNASGSATSDPTATGGVHLIAIVDDDAPVRSSTARLIRSFGYRADAYASGPDFLGSPHLPMTACALLDVRMPDMDGLEVQRRLTADGYRIPVIFISGRASADEERRARAVGDFMRKPVAPALLRHRLRALLSQRGRHRGHDP